MIPKRQFSFRFRPPSGSVEGAAARVRELEAEALQLREDLWAKALQLREMAVPTPPPSPSPGPRRRPRPSGPRPAPYQHYPTIPSPGHVNSLLGRTPAGEVLPYGSRQKIFGVYLSLFHIVTFPYISSRSSVGLMAMFLIVLIVNS